jgi:hypothetical protein
VAPEANQAAITALLDALAMQRLPREERFSPSRWRCWAALRPLRRCPRIAFRHIAWPSAAIAIAGTLALLGCGKEEKQVERPPPTVSTITVEPHTVPVSMDFIAQTQSSQQVEIYARVTGFLDKRVYQEGAIHAALKRLPSSSCPISARLGSSSGSSARPTLEAETPSLLPILRPISWGSRYAIRIPSRCLQHGRRARSRFGPRRSAAAPRFMRHRR